MTVNTQPFFWIFGALNLANLLSAVFMGRVWERKRFVTPAEPLRFFSSVLTAILLVGFAVLMIVLTTDRPGPVQSALAGAQATTPNE